MDPQLMEITLVLKLLSHLTCDLNSKGQQLDEYEKCSNGQGHLHP